MNTRLIELKKGNKIMIYLDPMIQRRPEGRALLIRKIDETEDYEIWLVDFIGEASYEHKRRPGYRVIKKTDHKELLLEIQAVITNQDGVVTSAGESMPIKYDAQEDTPDAAYLNLSDAVFKCWERVSGNIHQKFYEWARDKCTEGD